MKTIVILAGCRMEFDTMKEAADFLQLSYITVRLARAAAYDDKRDIFKVDQCTFIVGPRGYPESEPVKPKKERSKLLLPGLRTYP